MLLRDSWLTFQFSIANTQLGAPDIFSLVAGQRALATSRKTTKCGDKDARMQTQCTELCKKWPTAFEL